MIVVFGSINIDLVFPVATLPQSGETVICPNYHQLPGGKGANQAVAAVRAGAKTGFAGCIGDDEYGKRLIGSLHLSGVDTSAIAHSDLPTGCAAISVDNQGRNQISVAAGANLALRASQVPDDWLGPETIVLLQMEIPAKENMTLAARAQKAGARVMLNAAPAQLVTQQFAEMIDILMVNELEALTLATNFGLDESKPDRAACALAKMMDCACIVTLGASGAVGFSRKQRWAIDSLKVSVVDTVAAGDAFAGVFAAALVAGAEFPEAMHKASIAGGLACARKGAQDSLPSAAEINARMGDLAAAKRITEKR